MTFHKGSKASAGLFLTLVLALASSLHAELIGQWTFNEASGSTAYDTSCHFNHASLVNAPSRVSSPGGKAVSLNGTNQYINLGASAASDLPPTFSLEAWMKVAVSGTGSGEPLIFGKGTGLYGISYYYNNAGTYFYGGTSGTNHLADFPLGGDWRHVVGVSEATPSGITMRFYVDGEEVGTRTSSGAPGSSSSVSLLAGTDPTLSAFLQGEIDELRLYDHALTEDEVLAHYAAGPVETVYISPSDNLEAAIEGAADHTQFVLSSGTHSVSGDIKIESKGLQIVGQGKYQTTVKAATNVYILFHVADGTEDLIIHRMKIEGTPPAPPATFDTHAIGSSSSTPFVVRRVAFRDLLVTDIAVGISVGGGINGTYDGAIIERNAVVNASGTNPGHGYGLHNDSAINVLMRKNYVEHTERHGIYQARSGTAANIVIEDNLILNHNYSMRQTNRFASALCIARSSSVRCAQNLIVNSRICALSVEFDNVHSWPVNDVELFYNRVIGSHDVGLWGNTGTVVPDFITHIVPTSTNPWSDIQEDDGTAFTVPDSRWDDAEFMTEAGGKFYVMANGVLDEFDPVTWTYRTSPTDWFNTEGMTAMDGKLYIVQNSVLHEVDPVDWSYRYDSITNWGGTDLMTAASGSLYIVQNGTMHRVDPSTWGYTYSSVGWSGVQALYSWDGDPYCMQNDQHYRIGVTSLAKSLIGQ